MKRFIITLAVLLFAVFGLQAQDWAKAKLEKSPRHQEWVKVKHGRARCNASSFIPK